MILSDGLSFFDGCASKNGTLRDREQPRREAEAHELDRMIMPDAKILQAVVLHAIDATCQPSSDLTDVAMITPPLAEAWDDDVARRWLATSALA